MSLYDTYIEQAKLVHQNDRKWRGTTVVKYIPIINEIIKSKQIKTILDYGCGKAQNHPKEWNATKYDPAVPEFSAKPDRRFDLVISTDVLEHIPEESIDEVLKDIFNYSDQWVFLTICTREAREILPNGMNAHATVKPEEWWNDKLKDYSRYTVMYS